MECNTFLRTALVNDRLAIGHVHLFVVGLWSEEDGDEDMRMRMMLVSLKTAEWPIYHSTQSPCFRNAD
jgi:hypothetical protein